MIDIKPRTFFDLVEWGQGSAMSRTPEGPEETHGTTVLALRYDGGVLTLADRRATMGKLLQFQGVLAASFVDLGLSPALAAAAAAAGWTTPTDIQRAAIPAILRDRDLLALAPTGAGPCAGAAAMRTRE